MNRSARLGAAAVATLAALHVAAPAAAAAPVARPNPALTFLQVDYASTPTAPTGRPTLLAPLSPAVIPEAVADQAYLTYKLRDDLGGFLPAPVGTLAIRGAGGHALTGSRRFGAQIPQFAQAASGKVNSFAFLPGASSPAPQPGTQPVPLPPPSNANTPPPPNQGFGGLPPPTPPGATTAAPPAGTTTAPSPPPTTVSPPGSTVSVPAGGTTSSTSTTTAPRPPTTAAATTTAATTSATLTAAAPTTSAAAGGGGGSSSGSSGSGGSGASCGTTGLVIESDHASCVIRAVNMAPGGSASEVMTIRNDTSAPFTLSLQATGTQNALWNALDLGVWKVGTAAPNPLPPLLWWTTKPNEVDTLAAGESARYNVELLLPSTAGNTLMSLTATIDFVWTAQG